MKIKVLWLTPLELVLVSPFKKVSIIHVGGCHVPGLNDCPDPVGSEDLKIKFNNVETLIIGSLLHKKTWPIKLPL
jgi:hypothetical protein